MKLGLGLYRDLLTRDNFKFARQAGATHIVAHLVNYFKGSNPSLSRGDDSGWGVLEKDDETWSVDGLIRIRREMEEHGLTWEAIENFDPSHWHDILLDGPRKAKQLEKIKQIIRNVGEAGIPVIGYNFSIAGVWGWSRGPVARGGAVSVRFNSDEIDVDTPIPRGMVWNMVYDPTQGDEDLPPVSEEEIWQRLEEFLKEVVPVAEEAGVRLAAHPDDPPMESLRRAARLVNQPWKYKKLVSLVESPANGLEYCLGSVQEMREGDLYESLEHHVARDDIGYIHFRNVKGKVPDYHEVFVDEGDIDMRRVIEILKKHDYRGTLIPDHTPEMSCDAPWHSGKAYALGYMKGLIDGLK